MSAFPMMTIDLTVATDWQKGLLRNSPVGDAIIGSPFAAAGDSVFHTAQNPHSGQDFPCPEGIAIHDRLGGVVLRSGWDEAAGWWVTIGYPSGYSSFYCHMRAATTLNAGDIVPQDGVVGFVGSTGSHTTGDHLHWTLNDRTGRPIDPMLYVGADGLDFESVLVPSGPPAVVYPTPVVEWVAAGWGAIGNAGIADDPDNYQNVTWAHTYKMRAQTVKANALINLHRDGRSADGWEEFTLYIQDYEE